MAECSGGAGLLFSGFKQTEEVSGAQRCLRHSHSTFRECVN